MEVIREHLDADVARSVAGAFGRHPFGSDWDNHFDLVDEAEWEAYFAAYDAVLDAHGYYCDCCRDRHLTSQGEREMEAVDRLLPASRREWRRIRNRCWG